MDLPEIGLSASIPSNWKIRYNAKHDFIHISSMDDSAGIIILRGCEKLGNGDCIKLISSEIDCRDLDLSHSKNSNESTCIRDGQRISLKALNFTNYKLIYYILQEGEASLTTMKTLIDSLKISKPIHGIYEDRVRIHEEKYRWSVTVPRTWIIKPYGIFNLGFIARVGTIITWLTFYPLLDEKYIGDMIKHKHEQILSKIKNNALIKSQKKESSIDTEFEKNGIRYELYLSMQKHEFAVNNSSISFIAEVGYIFPKFMKEEISYLVNDILSSFSFGPNFLSDLEKLKKHEHCMLSIAILSRFIGKSLNEIFDKYFTIIDKEMITTLSTEIESVFP